MIELPAADPGKQAMPMMAPDVRYAFCRFDLSTVRCELSATVADDLWLIGLYTAEGDNFYAVTGADLKKANIELVIASADQTVEERASIRPRAPTKS